MKYKSYNLKDVKEAKNIQPKDVVLYGFGRIGRLLARELMTKMGKGSQLRLRLVCIDQLFVYVYVFQNVHARLY